MMLDRAFHINRSLRLTALALAVAALAPGQSRAANLTPLVSFNGTDGARPRAGLLADANGNLFGTTEAGGALGFGTVFEIAKTAGGYASTPTVLVSFNGTNGADPEAGLIADANGNLFGTTASGGANGGGTVFEIAKIAGGYASTPTVLVSFCSQTSCAGGAEPVAGLIADANGNLFGTTEFGGANGGGTVFEIAKTAGGYASTPTVLVSFNRTNGSFPEAGLLADANGNLFGTTRSGGANDLGTVFEIAKTAGGYASTPTVLVSFNGTNGADPEAGLIADANGNLFGTTVFGGANRFGTVFEIAKTASGYASTPTVLVSFCGQTNCADGAVPLAGLLADANGNLFGTTASGGANRFGTVFEIAKTAGGYASTPTVLVSFNGTDGALPEAGLIADANGNLFGTTQSGGANAQGTVFEITGSGFVGPFAGTPGTANCIGTSVSALAKKYGGLNAAAAALGYPGETALQNAIAAFCGGSTPAFPHA